MKHGGELHVMINASIISRRSAEKGYVDVCTVVVSAVVSILVLGRGLSQFDALDFWVKYCQNNKTWGFSLVGRACVYI